MMRRPIPSRVLSRDARGTFLHTHSSLLLLLRALVESIGGWRMVAFNFHDHENLFRSDVRDRVDNEQIKARTKRTESQISVRQIRLHTVVHTHERPGTEPRTESSDVSHLSMCAPNRLGIARAIDTRQQRLFKRMISSLV